jgi:hypothetical protein
MAATRADINAAVIQRANEEVTNAELRRKQLIKDYKDEDLVDIYLSPMYKPYFGNVMRVMINGISIYFKVDGSTQKVPKSFADEITQRRLAVDSILNKQHKMADIPNNVETSPGEINLF